MREYVTTVASDSMVGEDYNDKEGFGRVRDISFFDLMFKCGFMMAMQKDLMLLGQWKMVT